jgi:hypothetical protein
VGLELNPITSTINYVSAFSSVPLKSDITENLAEPNMAGLNWV